MKLLVFLLIAVSWVGWFVAWGRDRQFSGAMFGAQISTHWSGRLAPPRSGRMARRRRREVLAGLGLMAVLTFLAAQAWSAMWVLQITSDLALLGYAAAVLSIERRL